MKFNLRTIGLLSFAFMLTIAACKKDDDTPATPTTKEYLTAGNWKVTAMTIDPGVDFNGTLFTDFYSMMPTCSKDDLMLFNVNGTVTDDEGATKCDPDDPQTQTDGTWALSSDNKTLTVTYPDDTVVLTISTINGTTIVGTYSMVEDFGDGDVTYLVTITFTLQ